MTWWTMREEGDMVDYEGEGDRLVSFAVIEKGNILSIVPQVINSLCVANYMFV